MLRKMLDAVFVRDALGSARRQLAEDERAGGRFMQQARLLAEVIRRVAEPAENLPAGDRATIILTLAREAVFLILTAAHVRAVDSREGAAPPTELEVAWASAPAGLLEAAVPDAAVLSALKDLLVTPARPGASARDEDAVAARAFVDKLLWNADALPRRIERLLVHRFVRLTLGVVVLCLVGLGIRALAMGSNLAAGKPFRTSSSWSDCPSDPNCGGVLLVHTNPENEPWIEFDLGTPTKIHRVDVTNRGDCCAERALPLVVEVSGDRTQWTEVGRRVEEFAQWSLKIPPRTTRYVRLRVARSSVLNLKDVAIR